MREVDLFVVHWNQPRRCLETLKAFDEQGVSLRITVIDNGSRAELLHQLEAELPPETRVLNLESNHGWGGALNVALASWLKDESNSYCLISAHDAIPASGCLVLLIAAAEADPQLGIVCPQYPEPFVAEISRLHGVYPQKVNQGPSGLAQIVSVPHGTLMLLRRECLQSIGLFDPRYFAYGDEHELGLRATRRGWKVGMVWGAIVTNPETSTASRWRSYLFARNSLILVRDYFGRLAVLMRAAAIILSASRRPFSNRDSAFSAGERLRAVRDYFAGRNGRPTFS